MGSPYSMKEAVRNDTVIEVEAREMGEAQRKELAELPGVSAVSMEFLEGRQLARVVVDEATSLIPTVAAMLDRRKVISIRVDQPTLEDAYIKLVNGK